MSNDYCLMSNEGFGLRRISLRSTLAEAILFKIQIVLPSAINRISIIVAVFSVSLSYLITKAAWCWYYRVFCLVFKRYYEVFDVWNLRTKGFIGTYCI